MTNVYLPAEGKVDNGRGSGKGSRMDPQVNGKTAIVTGTSAGIGKAIAFALAREGVDVAICARRREPLEAAASQIARETNHKIVAIPADLTKPAHAEAFVKQPHPALRPIDIPDNTPTPTPPRLPPAP